jgi:hypothetical protein
MVRAMMPPMRRLLPLAVFPAMIALLSGCPSPPLVAPGDPPADCATRGKPVVEVGTGTDTFTATTDGLLIESGIQGGNHIWLSVWTKNLGPTVVIEYGIRDPQTGDLISQGDLSTITDLAPRSDGAAEAVAIQDRIDGDAEALIGKKVVLFATVTDACPHTAGGEAIGLVKGFDDGQNPF